MIGTLNLGELAKPALEAFASRGRAADDQYRVIAADSAEDIRPRLAVECGRDGLGAARYRSYHDQLSYTVDARQQLRKKGVQSRASGATDTAIGNGVADSLRCGNARESKLSQVP